MWAFIGGTALLIAIVWIVPITPRAHPLARANEPVASTTASSDRETAIAHYGPLAAGVALSDGFVIRRITVRARIARIETSDDRGRTLVFELAPPGVDMPRGPFDAGTAAMLVRQTDLASDVYQPVGNALLDLLRKAAAPGALDVAIAHWIQAHAERAP